MKSKFAKKTLAALALAAALTSVASMSVLAEDAVITTVAAEEGVWTINDDLTVWADESTIDWTNGTIAVTVTLEKDGEEQYVRTLTASIIPELTKASTCTTDGEVSFGATVTVEGEAVGSVKSNAYTNQNDLKHGHSYELTSTVITEPTCTETGTTVKTYTCSECGYSYTDEKTTKATGHSYGEMYVDPDRLDNILTDSDGNIVFDSDGNPQAEDPTKNASYYLIQTCENTNSKGEVCGHIKEETEKYVVIPVSVAYEKYVFVDVSDDGVDPWQESQHLFEAYFNEDTYQPLNTKFVAPYSNGSWSQIYDAIYSGADIADYIRLVDCTKDGYYTVIGYNVIDEEGDPLDIYGNWNNILSVTSYKIEAQHYELTAEIDEDNPANSSYLLTDEDGIVPRYDEDGNIVGAYNTHCSEEATVVLQYRCSNCGDIVKYETVTIPATGVHQYDVESVKKADDVEYTDCEDGVHHTYTTVQQCAICGEWFAAEDGTEVHHFEMVKEEEEENLATCGTSGFYYMVVRCKECGYEQSRILVPTEPTDKHVYGDYEFTWDGNLYVEGGQDGNLVTTKVTVGQTCINCNGEGEEGHEGVLTSDTIAVGQTGEYVDVYHGDEYIGTLILKIGEPSDATDLACKPQTVELTATLIDVETEDENGLPTILAQDSKTVTYYGSVADYEARTAHVAGTATTVVENGVTYSVTKCLVCGDEISREVVSTSADTEDKEDTEDTKDTDDADEEDVILPSTTSLKAVAAGQNQVRITWDAVEGADGYIVLWGNYDEKGQYQYNGIVGYTPATTFLHTSADSEGYNFYWVVAYYKNSAGTVVRGKTSSTYAWALGVEWKYVSNLAAVSSSTGVSLTWDATAGAEGYIVRSKTASQTTWASTEVTTTSYVDVNASTTEETFYIVLPYYTTSKGLKVVGTYASYVYGIKG